MSRPASVTLSDLTRALKAAAEAGLPVREIRLTSGEARVLFSVDDPDPPPEDKGKPREW